MSKRKCPVFGDPLTPRELEVLQIRILGSKYWEVADDLDISEKTVQFHLGNVRKKLFEPGEVFHLALLLHRAARRGILPKWKD